MTEIHRPVMKPSLQTAMQTLITEIRQALPLHLDQAQLCQGPCQGCSKKLLEYLDTELEQQESALQRGHIPRFGDLQRLARSGRKIHQTLIRNGIINH